MQPARFYRRGKDRYRIIAQEVYEILDKGEPELACISVALRGNNYLEGFSLPTTRSFRPGVDFQLVNNEAPDWTEFGGYRRLRECIAAEFGSCG
jgi:hypothetical protein